MAASLQSWIDAGYELGREINSVALINFFASSDALTLAEAVKRKKSRQERGLIGAQQAEIRYCAAGSKCLKAYKRKGAAVTGGGQFCSTACAASARARAKRQVA